MHVRPKNELRAAAMRLHRVRKLVLALKSQIRGEKTSGNEWDVLKTLHAAILIAEFGQSSRAEDAIEAADQVQIFWLLIETQLNQLCAHLGHARRW